MNIYATPAIHAELSEEEIQSAVQALLEIEPAENIEFIDPDHAAKHPNEVAAMYTAAYLDGRPILLFPTLRDGERCFMMCWESELPAMDGLHKYGGEYPPKSLGGTCHD